MKKNTYFFWILLLLTGTAAALDKPNDSTSRDNDIELLIPVSEFKPFLADPKWPKFTLAHMEYIEGSYGRHVFAPNFGAVLPFVRSRGKDGSISEWGLHAGIFSIMDLGSRPTRLINSDFFVGPAFTYQQNRWGYLFRVSHTSSHLGDEFLLSPQGKDVKRINLSYEAIEAYGSYRLDNGLRPYLGVGYLVDTDPESYQTWELTGGADFHSPTTIIDGYGRLVYGFQSKASKNSLWNPNVSIKGGLELEDKVVIGKTLQILLEYFYGNSIHGQFYTQVESYVGLSTSVNF